MLHSELMGFSADLHGVSEGIRLIREPEVSESVAILQNALVSSRFELPDAGVDGWFLTETTDAVRQFQKDRDLGVDGIVGRNTCRQLDIETAYQEGVVNDQVLAQDRVLVMDPFAGAIADTVRPDLNIPERILRFFELSDEFCLSLSMHLTTIAGGFIGSFVEPFIERDYCLRAGPCSPATDFFDVVNGPGPYTDFLRVHNPGVAAGVISTVGASVRPDILSHRPGSQAEWYEIKPLSPAGLAAALAKGKKLRSNYENNGFPYKPGKRYRPSRNIRLAVIVTDAGERMEVFLEVGRPVPGLIFYRFCLRGDYVRYFNRVRLLAGLLGIIAALAPEAIAAGAVAEEVAVAIAALRALATSLGAVLPVFVNP